MQVPSDAEDMVPDAPIGFQDKPTKSKVRRKRKVQKKAEEVEAPFGINEPQKNEQEIKKPQAEEKNGTESEMSEMSDTGQTEQGSESKKRRFKRKKKKDVSQSEGDKPFEDAQQKSEADESELNRKPSIIVEELYDLSGIDLNKFVMEALPQGKQLKCIIKRERNLLARYVRMRLDDAGRLILNARIKIKTLSAYYHISLNEKNIGPDHQGYLGRLKVSNQNEYTLFDSNQNQKKRRQYLRINFKPNPPGIKCPRKITVLLPKKQPCQIENLCIDDEPHFKLQNIKPKWNQVCKTYVLNFKGRVSKPSVKNFIMSYPDSDEYLLLFGKVSDSYYHLDFKWPFSPIQALAMALASFAHTVI